MICQPLIVLLKKEVIFKWTSDHSVAFQTLKKAPMAAPVLSLPDFSTPFTIETNTSDIGIGAVLMQRGRPIAFLSKALGPKAHGLSTYEKRIHGNSGSYSAVTPISATG